MDKLPFKDPAWGLYHGEEAKVSVRVEACGSGGSEAFLAVEFYLDSAIDGYDRMTFDIPLSNVRLLLAKDKAQEKLAGLENRLREAVNEECSCGGKGPSDEGVCTACRIWHHAITLEHLRND